MVETGIQSLRGLRPFTMPPSARYTIPSAWKPGCALVKPRSTTASAPFSSVGRWPVSRNHDVPQAGPQGSPTVQGSYAASRATSNGTGSPT